MHTNGSILDEISAPVKIRITPGRRAATEVSRLLILACASGLCRIATWAVLGRSKSAVNFALPVNRFGSSLRLTDVPSTCVPILVPPLSRLSHQRFDRANHVLIHTTTADVAVNPLADLRLTGLRISTEQVSEREHHPGCAVSTLNSMLLPESRLKSRENAAFGHSFDGGDIAPVCLDGQHRATLHRQSINEHRTGTAMAGIAAKLCASQAKAITQKVHQQHVGRDRLPMLPPIYR